MFSTWFRQKEKLLFAILQIDFLVGREVEVGKIYKGVISSVKEYSAFVELNGGQHGLLHISELSHDQVSIANDLSLNGLISAGYSEIWPYHCNFLHICALISLCPGIESL